MDLKLFCLLRKLLPYINFTSWSSSIFYFSLSMAEGNLYSSNHNCAIRSYERSNFGRNTGSFTALFHNNQQKQGDSILSVCCNFTNGKHYLPTCQYKHQCFHYASDHQAKHFPSNEAALGSNPFFVQSR